MRLTDMKPRWIGLNAETWSAPTAPCHFGVTFLCPHCGIRIGVLFRPFIDPLRLTEMVAWAMPGAPDPNTGVAKEVKWWDRIMGETFDDLTLSPSINVESHWHGHLTAGQLT